MSSNVRCVGAGELAARTGEADALLRIVSCYRMAGAEPVSFCEPQALGAERRHGAQGVRSCGVHSRLQRPICR